MRAHLQREGSILVSLGQPTPEQATLGLKAPGQWEQQFRLGVLQSLGQLLVRGLLR